MKDWFKLPLRFFKLLKREIADCPVLHPDASCRRTGGVWGAFISKWEGIHCGREQHLPADSRIGLSYRHGTDDVADAQTHEPTASAIIP